MSVKTLQCIDCSQPFELSEGEQEFYEKATTDDGKPFTLPKRCKRCRQAKKRRMQGFGMDKR